MKAIAVVLAVCFVAVLGQLTDEQKAKLQTYKDSCIAETGVDPNVVKDAKEGKVDEDNEKLACFATCMLKKSGVMTANGDIDVDAIRSKIPQSIPQEDVDRVINECKDFNGTGCSKGGKIMKCLLEKKALPLLQ